MTDHLSLNDQFVDIDVADGAFVLVPPPPAGTLGCVRAMALQAHTAERLRPGEPAAVAAAAALARAHRLVPDGMRDAAAREEVLGRLEGEAYLARAALAQEVPR